MFNIKLLYKTKYFNNYPKRPDVEAIKKAA